MAQITYAHARDHAVVAFTGELDWGRVPGARRPHPGARGRVLLYRRGTGRRLARRQRARVQALSRTAGGVAPARRDASHVESFRRQQAPQRSSSRSETSVLPSPGALSRTAGRCHEADDHTDTGVPGTRVALGAAKPPQDPLHASCPEERAPVRERSREVERGHAAGVAAPDDLGVRIRAEANEGTRHGGVRVEHRHVNWRELPYHARGRALAVDLDPGVQACSGVPEDLERPGVLAVFGAKVHGVTRGVRNLRAKVLRNMLRNGVDIVNTFRGRVGAVAERNVWSRAPRQATQRVRFETTKSRQLTSGNGVNGGKYCPCLE